MANRVEVALSTIAKDLKLVGHPFAVVGGLAVSVRARPRMTADVDVAIGVEDDREAEAVVRALTQRGYRVRATIEHAPTGRLATARLTPASSAAKGVIVDLLFSASGLEREIVAEASPCQIGQLRFPTAIIGHLIAMKILSLGPNRPDDESDLIALIQVASPTDLAIAKSGLRTIARRGFGRSRDLLSDLKRVERAASFHGEEFRPRGKRR